MKHRPGVNLEDLDFKAVDKEIEANEVAQVAQASVASGEDPLEADKGGDNAPST